MENAETEEVTLDMEIEPEPEPAKVEIDQAAEAFARLEGEMALMRRAVQHLAAERADIVIPDYGPTLTEMTKRLGAIAGSIGDIAEHPAMQITPDGFGRRIEAAAEAARRVDQGRINDAHNELRQAAQDMRAVTSHARTSAEQRRKLFQAVGGGVLGGILLWSFLPGTIARAMPESWQWPERMAARMVGEETPWTAGIRLMRAGDPGMWNAIVQASMIARENREAITGCVKSANATRQSVRCSVRVQPMGN
ncbi:MAG: DUF6118 family protein [Novosphingobium sp.]